MNLRFRKINPTVLILIKFLLLPIFILFVHIFFWGPPLYRAGVSFAQSLNGLEILLISLISAIFLVPKIIRGVEKILAKLKKERKKKAEEKEAFQGSFRRRLLPRLKEIDSEFNLDFKNSYVVIENPTAEFFGKLYDGTRAPTIRFPYSWKGLLEMWEIIEFMEANPVK